MVNDVGWNPIQPIFHERSGSQRGTRRTRGKTQGETREESLEPTRFDYTRARSSKHKEIHDPRSTKDDTKVIDSSP